MVSSSVSKKVVHPWLTLNDSYARTHRHSCVTHSIDFIRKGRREEKKESHSSLISGEEEVPLSPFFLEFEISIWRCLAAVAWREECRSLQLPRAIELKCHLHAVIPYLFCFVQSPEFDYHIILFYAKSAWNWRTELSFYCEKTSFWLGASITNVSLPSLS